MSIESSDQVAIRPVTPDVREAVLALAPAPGQEVFSGVAADTLPEAERDPQRVPYVIVTPRGGPAGFFVLDAGESPADPSAGLTLRAFFVDARFQGQGVAGRALAGLSRTIRCHHRDVQRAMLTVNCRNTVAYALYLRHGWVDTGDLYLGGDAGPQRVLTLEV